MRTAKREVGDENDALTPWCLCLRNFHWDWKRKDHHRGKVLEEVERTMISRIIRGTTRIPFDHVPITARRCIRRGISSIPDFPPPSPIPLTDSSQNRTPPPSKPSPLLALMHKSNLYMTVHINGFPFLLSPNDTLHLPFHLREVPIGSVLRMTNVSRIGVRDYTLQGRPFIDPKVFTCKLRVIEHTKQPIVVTVKTRRRRRRHRHLPNKQNYTVLKYGFL